MTIEDGVRVDTAVAPSAASVHPLIDKLQPETNAGSVYRDLRNKLLNPTKPVDPHHRHPDKTVAHVLSVCAGYAYSDVGTMATMMTRMGLARSRCVSVSLVVDAMFIVSTAYVIQSQDGKVVILVYRGTEPANVISWLTDADVHPEKVEFNLGGNRAFELHAGFYRNVRATRFKVGEVLRRALRGESIEDSRDDATPQRTNPMEALYITGHSLGGAMAAIMGLALQTEQPYRGLFLQKLQAVYTFGQPMVGSGGLADAWLRSDDINHEMIRYIFQKDPVPHLPPHDTGAFSHFGREYQFAGGEWHPNKHPAAQMKSWFGIVGAIGAAVLRHFPGWRNLPSSYQLYDHSPQHYIAALTPRGVTTEFGDHSYVRNGGGSSEGRRAGSA